ncbi:MAG TPA: TetR/AcrR family transcriptional regulator [Cytophagales bacterium]|jgi:AcrR family transcriptional regulator
MTTKEKILEAARELFNKEGIDAITTRHVAARLGISHGNLCYHYPRKELIIERLYYDLVEKLDEAIGRAPVGELDLAAVFALTRHTFEVQYHYRFILLHMVGIMRKIESVGAHFRGLLVKRKAQFGYLIELLTQKGVLQPERFPGQYGHFITQFYIVGDFWISEAEILFEGPEAGKIPYYTRLAQAMLLPYLTERGLAEFEKLLPPAAPASVAGP